MRILWLPMLALLASAASAQTMPPAFPTRDVTVTYQPSNGPEMQMSWLVAEQRVRIDVQGSAGAVLMNMRDRKGHMIMPDQRMAMELPVDGMPTQPGQLPPGAKVTKEGADQVIGIACTNWLTEFQGARSQSCITADGVLLRVRGAAGQDEMNAKKVTYAPQDPTKFRVPDGFQTMPMPGAPAPQAR